MRLVDTTDEDLAYDHDMCKFPDLRNLHAKEMLICNLDLVIPMTKESKGVRVTIV